MMAFLVRSERSTFDLLTDRLSVCIRLVIVRLCISRPSLEPASEQGNYSGGNRKMARSRTSGALATILLTASITMAAPIGAYAGVKPGDLITPDNSSVVAD